MVPLTAGRSPGRLRMRFLPGVGGRFTEWGNFALRHRFRVGVLDSYRVVVVLIFHPYK